MRKTKIIATIGPGSDSTGATGRACRCGHGYRPPQCLAFEPVSNSRSGSKRFARPPTAPERRVAVMLDLAGPKLRVGEMASDTRLEPGTTFVLTPGECDGQRGARIGQLRGSRLPTSRVVPASCSMTGGSNSWSTRSAATAS